MVTPVNWNMKYACMYIVIKIVDIGLLVTSLLVTFL